MPPHPADALLDALTGAPSVLLTGPVRPDGDSLGACLALARVLERGGVPVHVTGEAGYRYDWLPGADRLLGDGAVPTAHTVVVLDGDRHRLTPGVRAAWDRAQVRGIVDHHASTTPDGYELFWVDPDATSTCEMLYTALLRRGEPLDLDLATLLHAGSVFDTGCFRYDNTTPATLAMAADLIGRGVDHAGLTARMLGERRWPAVQALSRVTGAARRHLGGQLVVGRVPAALSDELRLIPDDLEGLIETLNLVSGVQVAVLLIDRPDGGTKVSLRSRGRVDVCALAKELVSSGGGHHKAAGAVVDAAADPVEERIVALVSQALVR
jgi:phosphoesterase RecJ-like protein